MVTEWAVELRFKRLQRSALWWGLPFRFPSPHVAFTLVCRSTSLRVLHSSSTGHDLR